MHHSHQEKVAARQRLPYTFAPAAPRETPASRTLEEDGQASWTRGTAWDLSSASATARRGGSAAEAGALQHGRSEQHGLGGRFKDDRRSKTSQNTGTSILTPECGRILVFRSRKKRLGPSSKTSMATLPGRFPMPQLIRAQTPFLFRLYTFPQLIL